MAKGMTGGMKMAKGAPKRAQGQGTGHLKAASVNAFGTSPKKGVTHGKKKPSMS